MKVVLRVAGWLLLICGTIWAGIIYFQLKANGSLSSYAWHDPHPLRLFYAATVFFGALIQSLIMIGIASVLHKLEDQQGNGPTLDGKVFLPASNTELFVRVYEYAERFNSSSDKIIEKINSNKLTGKREKGIYYVLVNKEKWGANS